MSCKLITLCLAAAAMALFACSSTPEPADTETGETPAGPPPGESGESTAAPPDMELPARVGLMRVQDAAWRVVHEYTSQFYEGDLDTLHARFSDEFRESMPLPMLTELRRNVLDQLGQETKVVGEESQEKNEYRGFVRWVRFEKFDGVVEMLWILREDDSIAGFFIRPAKEPQG